MSDTGWVTPSLRSSSASLVAAALLLAVVPWSAASAATIPTPTPTPTKVATTAPPTTKAPTTAAPTTKAPTTAAPTTKAPTTAAPTTAAPTTSAPPKPEWCRKMIVIGARGAGEPPGFGGYLNGFTDRMATLMGDDVWLQPVDYPATITPQVNKNLQYTDPEAWDANIDQFMAAMVPSVVAGAGNVAWLLKVIDEECPTAEVVLAGYSQGTVVIRAGIRQHGANKPKYHIVLFGDPSLSSEDGIQAVGGDSGGGNYFVVPRSPLVTGIQYNMVDSEGTDRGLPQPVGWDGDGIMDDISLCHIGDTVCDAKNILGPTPWWFIGPHHTYSNDAWAVADYMKAASGL